MLIVLLLVVETVERENPKGVEENPEEVEEADHPADK
jgi:hypothetical protein